MTGHRDTETQSFNFLCASLPLWLVISAVTRMSERRSRSRYRFEHARLAILANLVPLKVPPVHRDVDAGLQDLHE